MSEALTAIFAFIVIAILLYSVLLPGAKAQAKAMDDPNTYRKIGWQDGICPEDTVLAIRLLNSWFLMSVAIPVSSWFVFLIFYKLGWFVDGRQAVINIYWLPIIFFSLVMLLGLIAYAILDRFGGKTLRGIPFWKKLMMFKDFYIPWKLFLAVGLAGAIASRLALGWAFVGGVIFFGITR